MRAPTVKPSVDINGLTLAVRRKLELVERLHTMPFAQWPPHVGAFLKAISETGPRDPAALLTLLIDLIEQIRTLVGPEVASRIRLTCVDGAVSVTSILKTVELELFQSLADISMKRKLEHTMIPHVRQFIGEHYQERLTLDSLAALFGRNRGWLSFHFRSETGITLHDYITKVRIDRAADLIRQGEKVEAVSLLVGYRSKKNFYRQFKALKGMNPGEFRG